MIYRTSHRSTYRQINNNLDLLSYRLAELNNQIASERRINRPSDDPSGAATVMRLRSMLEEVYQYKENLGYSDTWLTASGSAIQSIKETLDEIYKEAEQGATDTYTREQRGIIANEIDLLFDSIIKFGNSPSGLSNQYLFGGQKNTAAPFSLKMRAWDVRPGCQNSRLWTGQAVNYGDRAFNPRPDIATQSQTFLMEITSPGGIDGKFYANPVSSLTLGGSAVGYALNFQSLASQYHDTEIRIIPGTRPATTTGAGIRDAGITYSYPPGGGEYRVNYVLGTEAEPAGAAGFWDPAANTLTVTLKTDASGNSIASANEVVAAVNATAGLPAGFGAALETTVPANAGTGLVAPERIVFNTRPSVSVSGHQITVVLQMDENGQVLTTAGEVAALVAGHPQAGAMVSVAVTGLGATAAAVQNTFKSLRPGQPYTLARAVLDPVGGHNSLTYEIINGSGHEGAAGNNWSVRYVNGPPGSVTTAAFNPVTGEITVSLAVSAATGEVTARAAEVMSAVNAISAQSSVRVSLSDGNSGLGLVTALGPVSLSGGYDQPAGFRVSQDGGRTWGPPDEFYASEFQNGQLYYNSQLGHATLTTSLKGAGNDLIFTANYEGNWGRDIRVEYKSQPPGQPLKIGLGPGDWNIRVYLETDAAGNCVSTAEEVMKAVNQHPEAGQLVTVGLADYHEGGLGLVAPMELCGLTIDEAFLSPNGQSLVSPLGHAQAATGFPASAVFGNPNVTFQALRHGEEGNDIKIRYTTSADPTFYASASVANNSYQEATSIRYEYTSAGPVVVVHLATEALPSCPDPDLDYEASRKWQELYPLHSCTSSRAVVTTAGEIARAIVNKNLANPQSALVWASVDSWPEGLDSTAKVGPTATFSLSGGTAAQAESNHGVALRFIPDGSALRTGDMFEIPVGWYGGDQQGVELNTRWNYTTRINVTGADILGDNGAPDNVLDVLQRLSWALKRDDSEMIGAELPRLKAALEKITTQETVVGTRLIRNEFVANVLQNDYYLANDQLSQVEDANFEWLITELKGAQLAYEAALGATNLVTNISLLSYLR